MLDFRVVILTSLIVFLSSRGMYSLYNTWYWVVMSVLVFVFNDFVCKHQTRVVTYISFADEFKAFNIVQVV